jgi:hypothetical protein
MGENNTCNNSGRNYGNSGHVFCPPPDCDFPCYTKNWLGVAILMNILKLSAFRVQLNLVIEFLFL